MSKAKDGKNFLPEGKLPPALLEELLSLRGAELPEVIAGPGIGEDAALIRWQEDSYLVASSDPIVGAEKGAGHLLVAVNANDIACKGGDPKYLLVTILVPQSNGLETARSLMAEIDESCRNLGIAIVGGHTEMTSRYPHPVIVGTMLGPTRYTYEGENVRTKDVILMTKHAGLEGMSILANDRPDLLSFLTEDDLESIREWKTSLSVIPEAALIRDLAIYMHDPTEGGLAGGIEELSYACSRVIHIDEEAVPLSSLTQKASEHLDFDPRRLISSGVLLAVLPGRYAKEALKRLKEAEIPATIIGEIGERKSRDQAPESLGEELWRLLDLPGKKS
jgi:hydrogenase maturation factor